MRVSWWLDWSALPDRFWARLRVYPDGAADILDLDGRLHRFGNEEDARYWLLEDEYQPVEYLVEDGQIEPLVEPPQGSSDEAIVAEMQRIARADR